MNQPTVNQIKHFIRVQVAKDSLGISDKYLLDQTIADLIGRGWHTVIKGKKVVFASLGNSQEEQAPETTEEPQEVTIEQVQQNIIEFFQAMYDYCYTIVSDYIPQPHEYIYASRRRPVLASWARIEGAHYIQQDHKSNDWIFTLVAVPYELDEKTRDSYELELYRLPEVTWQAPQQVTICPPFSVDDVTYEHIRHFNEKTGEEAKALFAMVDEILNADEQTILAATVTTIRPVCGHTYTVAADTDASEIADLRTQMCPDCVVEMIAFEKACEEEDQEPMSSWRPSHGTECCCNYCDPAEQGEPLQQQEKLQHAERGEFDVLAHEDVISEPVRTSLVMRPCADGPRHGDNCYSFYRAGSDFCLFAHITYAEAYHHVYGRWSDDEQEAEDWYDELNSNYLHDLGIRSERLY